MSATLLILLYMIGSCFASVSAGICPASQAVLYPYGLDRNDRAIRKGDDQYFTLSTGIPIDFYGKKYTSIFVSMNGILSFTRPVLSGVASREPTRPPALTPYWADVKLTNQTNGALFFRKVNMTAEPDVVSMIETDSQNVGLPMTPEVILAFTWYKVLKYDGPPDTTNTFQAVVASDGNKTVAIFNYGSINWPANGNAKAAVMFSKGDQRTRVDYNISMTDEMLKINQYSNIGIPGRIVTRVDGDIHLEALTKLDCSSCVIDRITGNLTTFDGSRELIVHEANRKYLLSKIYQADQIDCKFLLKVITGANGSIAWVSFTVNRHLKRNFAFERTGNGVAEVRGRKKKMIITSFPYTEVFEEEGQKLTVIVEKLDGGWMVHSPTCQYYLVYKPQEASQQLQLFLGPYYKDNVFGMCQNNNNDVTDERKKCSRPPEDAVGDDFLKVIGDSCSCPKADRRCTKKLSRL